MCQNVGGGGRIDAGPEILSDTGMMKFCKP